MLKKKTYREVVKGLEFYKKQNDLDIEENPNAIRVGWGPSIRRMIEQIARKNYERISKDEIENTLRYLVKQGHLVDYCGDFTFPGTKFKTLGETIQETVKQLRAIHNG